MSKANKTFYKLETNEVEEILKVDRKVGLEKEDAEKRLEIYGENTFTREKKKTLFDRILDQVRNPLIYVLGAALVITLILEEYTNSFVIIAALGINVIVGIIQEGRASLAFEKLADSQEREAKVLRNGLWRILPAQKLVPGDIVSAEAGMNVPADLRLVETQDLLVDESLLTGEWKSVIKNPAAIAKNTEVTARANLAFMGSLVVGGHGVGIVVRTGSSTEVGKIAKNLDSIKEGETPAQKNINEILGFLAKTTAAIAAFIVIVGLLQGRELGEAAMIALAMSVSVIPEGLPASVTVVLAIGMETIMRKGGLVKNLLAAETLGSTTVILTDKTGTLTQSKMSIKNLITASNLEDNDSVDFKTHISPDQKTLLTMTLRSSDAYITEVEGETVVEGRPVERAIFEAGMELGFAKEALSEEHARLDLLSFESKNRFAASLNASPEGEVLYISGAPETILEGSAHVLRNGKPEEFDKNTKEDFLRRLKSESQHGRRFIALAYKPSSRAELSEKRHSRANELLENSIFAGLISLEDPIRDDVPEAIRTAQAAGMRVIMLTGDLPETAKSIGIQVGIATEKDPVILGKETAAMSDEELLVALHSTTLFARALPDQKLRISQVLKDSGEVVAMTGDGVNDAPALRDANIGIAVGSGTEVAKAASDLILIDNSFSVITEAIREGRRIVDNLKKIITYILSTNVSELVTIVGSLILGLQTPLIATQILWVNIIGEGFLNFALALEPAEKDVMKRDPNDVSSQNIMPREVIRLLLFIGVFTGLLLIGLYLALLSINMPIEEIRTIYFIIISFGTSFYAFAFKSLEQSFLQIKLFSNPVFIGSFLLNIAMLYLSLALPSLRTLLSLTPTTGAMIIIALSACLANLLIIEIVKYFTTVKHSPKRAVVIQ